jgi:hypothetical protein
MVVANFKKKGRKSKLLMAAYVVPKKHIQQSIRMPIAM